MKYSIFYKCLLTIGIIVFLYSCNDYETGGGLLGENWVYETTDCSISETEYIAAPEGQVGQWAFDKSANTNFPFQTKWERNAEKDGLCSSTHNWVYETFDCSISETEYIAAPEGQVGQWAFDKYIDANNPETQPDWRRNAEKDGQCGSTHNWVYETFDCSISETEYIAASEGQVGQWAFDKYIDANNPETQPDWRRNAGKDGQCYTGSADYTPTFVSTNITSGTYTGFVVYGNRIFAAELVAGIREYRNGTWYEMPEGMEYIQQYMFSPKIGVGANNKFFIANTTNGVYFQTGDNVYENCLSVFGVDMSGCFGGSNTNYFVSAGIGFAGIYKWDETSREFIATNVTDRSFYSIEALNETQVFFGSAPGSNSHVNDCGIMCYNGTSIVDTNITEGEYSLAAYNNQMYAANKNKNEVLVWYGNSFISISQTVGGTLKKVNDKLYLIASDGIYQCSGNSVLLFKGGSGFNDIVEHDGITYIIDSSSIHYLKNGTWYEIPDKGGFAAISSSSGLFVAQTGSGILKMEKQ